jgi:hypothetical protein
LEEATAIAHMARVNATQVNTRGQYAGTWERFAVSCRHYGIELAHTYDESAIPRVSHYAVMLYMSDYVHGQGNSHTSLPTVMSHIKNYGLRNFGLGWVDTLEDTQYARQLTDLVQGFAKLNRGRPDDKALPWVPRFTSHVRITQGIVNPWYHEFFIRSWWATYFMWRHNSVRNIRGKDLEFATVGQPFRTFTGTQTDDFAGILLHLRRGDLVQVRVAFDEKCNTTTVRRTLMTNSTVGWDFKKHGAAWPGAATRGSDMVSALVHYLGVRKPGRDDFVFAEYQAPRRSCVAWRRKTESWVQWREDGAHARKQIRQLAKTILKFAQWKKFRTHSFRRGGVAFHLALLRSIPWIMAVGGWRTMCFMRYFTERGVEMNTINALRQTFAVQ